MCLKEGGYSLGNMAPSMEGKAPPAASAPLCSTPGPAGTPSQGRMGQNLSQDLPFLSLPEFCAHFHFSLKSKAQSTILSFNQTQAASSPSLCGFGCDQRCLFHPQGHQVPLGVNKNGQTIPRLGKHQPAEIWGT